MEPDYVPVVTVMVRGLQDPESGVAFTKRLVAWLEDEEHFSDEDYSVALAHALYAEEDADVEDA